MRSLKPLCKGIIAPNGVKRSRPYHIFMAMKERCNNDKNINYKWYGGKGITVEWENFVKFREDMGEEYLEHCEQYGERNTTIDRIDNTKNYCKENCRWSTYKEQQNNRKGTREVVYKGKKYKSLTLLCEEQNVDRSLVLARLNMLGWDVENAIDYKPRGNKQNMKGRPR